MCLCINKTICVQATPSSLIHTAQLIDVMGRLTNHLTNEKTGKKGACWAPEVPYAQGGRQREEKLSYLHLACRSGLLCCLTKFGDDEENDEESLISLFTSNCITLFLLFLHITIVLLYASLVGAVRFLTPGLVSDAIFRSPFQRIGRQAYSK